MKYSFLLLIILPVMFFTGSNHKQEVKEVESGFFSDRKMFVGEELTYVVSYSFMKLGEVRIKVKDKQIINGKTFYSTIAYIDSYSGVPFVNLHQIYESRVTQNNHSIYFRGIVKEEEYSTFTEYNFDYDHSGKIRIRKGKIRPYQLWNDSTTAADKRYQDGLSILFYARMNLGKEFSADVPCFVKEEKVSTRLNFYTKSIPVSIDAVDYDINCLRLDGDTDFVSVFGLTGYFEGWFSNDEASIPIVAKMKVIIGNVTLELKKWKRDGWNPPKYNS
ncbi:MAG: DUF3108 domain-containing protein [Ignavibacteriaceae bacterium]